MYMYLFFFSLSCSLAFLLSCSLAFLLTCSLAFFLVLKQVASSQKRETQKRLTLHRWLHNMRFLRSFNLIIFLSLSFFEHPIWCYEMNQRSCTSEINAHILFFGLPVLPSSVTLTVEFVCVW